MKKILFILLILFILFLNGCVENITNQICVSAKHHPDLDENDTVYMDNGVCIMESKGYNRTFLFDCNMLKGIRNYKLDMIIKTNNFNLTVQKNLEELKQMGCEVTEL